MERLLKEERQQIILEMLQEHKRVTVPELSQKFGISEVTVRRDLHDLATSGKLMRAHRGAIEAAPAPPEAPIIQRMAHELQCKEQIARSAARMVTDGDAVFLGSGSTCSLLARMLIHHKQLTVVTNALNIAVELAQANNQITVVVTGGVMRAAELSLLGHITEQSLHEMRVDKIFMGVQALSLESGWTSDHLPEVATTRRILDMTRNLIVLADHSKLDKKAVAFIAPARRITTLITDEAADPLFVQSLMDIGVKVVIA
jgi:DeoR family transcriptional regulator, fructose operon transcriptional repressor